jgi:hypothetical protein
MLIIRPWDAAGLKRDRRTQASIGLRIRQWMAQSSHSGSTGRMPSRDRGRKPITELAEEVAKRLRHTAC